MPSPKTIHTLKTDKLSWVNATSTGETEMLYLEKTYNFNPLDTKECLPPLQRPKLIPRTDYLFLILVFPVFNRKTREIEPEEVDIFIRPNEIITVHNNHLQSLQNFFELLELNKEHREDLMSNPARFLSQLLDELMDGCFPMLLHISNDIENVSKKVLKGCTKETIHEILSLKNSIVSFRKAMQPHKGLIARLQIVLPQYFPIGIHAHYFNRLIDHCKEIWDNLLTYNFAADALHQTHTTLISFHLNEIIQTLTVFSIIIFTLTLIATIFSVGAPGTPFIDQPFGFWQIALLTLAVAALGIALFKKKGWL